MSVSNRKTVCVIAVFAIACFAVGCGRWGGRSKGTDELAAEGDLGATIGSLAKVLSPDLMAVQGYGLVGGLRGTGSAECPPQIRVYLTRHILRQLPEHKIDVGKLINSRNTAVVQVEGIMPVVGSKGRNFDVRVAALTGTQTSSLEGGWLYGAELQAVGNFGITSRVIAKAAGPVFVDTVSISEADKKLGYILAGGEVLDDNKVNLVLRRGDFRTTGVIRNRLNKRFGFGIAKAVSSGQIILTVPAKYRGQERKFISMVKAIYLDQTLEMTTKRIDTFVKQLAVSEDKDASEIVLEAMGSVVLGKLRILLNSSNEQVRLRAGRCILNLGSDDSLLALGKIVFDEGSANRIEALEAITKSASRSDAAVISRRLLSESDFDVGLAAYEQLRKLGDVSVTQKFIARSFYLEQITQTGHRAIYASRSGQPRIVLFGASLRCRDNIFVQSADGSVTINAPAGQQYVSLIRRNPKRPGSVAQLKSSFGLWDIIHTLCAEPAKKGEQGRGGLGVSYAEMIALLKQMCDKGAVRATFRAGPLPKIG